MFTTFTDGTVVDTLTSFLQQEQSVEVLEEDGVRLVDSTENGLKSAERCQPSRS
jgi:hypothetical protein